MSSDPVDDEVERELPTDAGRLHVDEPMSDVWDEATDGRLMQHRLQHYRVSSGQWDAVDP
jgi:hypothetical protein